MGAILFFMSIFFVLIFGDPKPNDEDIMRIDISKHQTQKIFNENDMITNAERERRNVGHPGRGRGPPGGKGQSSGGEEQPLKISVPPCLKEGITLIHGPKNYYLQCVTNSDAHAGGFFQVVYVCPPYSTSMSECLPPEDCSQCYK